MSLRGKYLILTKIKDLRFNGNHPNGINVSNTLQGYCSTDLILVNSQLFLYPTSDFSTAPTNWTSIVLEVNTDEQTITTKNSVYKFEVITNIKNYIDELLITIKKYDLNNTKDKNAQ